MYYAICNVAQRGQLFYRIATLNIDSRTSTTKSHLNIMGNSIKFMRF